MPQIKKLVFAVPFLVFLFLFDYRIQPLFNDSINVIFSFDTAVLLQIILVLVYLILAAISFAVFVTLASEWLIVLAVAAAGSVIPFFLSPTPPTYIFVLGSFLVFVITGAILLNKLKTYLTFQPTVLLLPSVKNLISLLILVVSVSYFFSVSSQLAKKPFEIPDSFIDGIIKITSSQVPVQGFRYDKRLIAQTPQIDPQTLEYLKKHPEIVRQYGYDPAILNQITPTTPAPKSSAKTQIGNPNPQPTPQSQNDLLKPLVKQQLGNMLKPYQNYIPLILTILFYLTLISFAAVLTIFAGPILWGLFLLLEKTEFVHFVTETREVKKLVV